MGTCFSKKKGSSSSAVDYSKVGVAVSSSTPIGTAVEETRNSKSKTQPNSEIRETNLKPLKKESTTETLHPGKQEQSEEGEETHIKKKQIFVIKHRKSHDGREKEPKHTMDHELVYTTTSADPSIEEATCTTDELLENKNNKAPTATATTPIGLGLGLGVKTKSCTEEEVDAILIQCGRLSRSSSGKATSSDDHRGRKYSGSKRSYDFDQRDNDGVLTNESKMSDNSADCEGDGGTIEKRHQHRQRTRNSSRGASPSSNGRRRTPSRERDQQRSSSRERRVSRSPGRRSSEPNSCNITRNYGEGTNRPSKMVSVPATVSSLVMDKSNNGGNENAIKRISVKRNVGDSAVMAGSRSAASPRTQSPIRTQSPARAKACNEGAGHQQPSLSRSSSRKAEQSPCRRNPLSEIDPNSLQYPQSQNNKCKRDVEVEDIFVKEVSNAQKQRPNDNKGGGRTSSRSRVDTKNTNTNLTIKDQRQQQQVSSDETKTIRISGTPQTLSRSRSLRCSRDLDEINPETLLNPTPSSYTRLLLDDIQNFHQKKTNNNNTNIINTSTTVVTLPQCVSKACSILEAVADLNSTTSSSLSEQSNRRYGHTSNKNLLDSKDPFVESEVIANDDLMEPSFHKYVTVRRGSDAEDQESSGSNSYVQQQNWGISSSSWEPNSADSINDGCSSSKSHTNPAETERNSGRPGIRRGSRPGATLQSVPFVATAATK